MKQNEKIKHELFSQLVEVRPYFWWWVRNKNALSIESIVEGVLAYGDMNDVYKLFKIVGIENVKQIFFQQIRHKRCNYTPRTRHFFKKVFNSSV
jgi:hypothetical protein